MVLALPISVRARRLQSWPNWTGQTENRPQPPQNAGMIVEKNVKSDANSARKTSKSGHFLLPSRWRP